MVRQLKYTFVFLFFNHMAIAGDYSITTGAEYTVGNYGTSIDTSMLYVPFILAYKSEKYSWSVTVPYVRISGSEDVLFSSTTHSPRLSAATTSAAERTDSGLGDIILTGRYQLQSETTTRPWLAMTGSIKFGTADEDKLLGTGENDYSVRLDIAKKALYGYVGYKVMGDSASIDYDNVLFASAGIAMPVNDSWAAGVDFYVEQAPVPGMDNAEEATISLFRPLGKTRRLNIYMIKGFTDASPDWGAGVIISQQL